MMFSKKLNITKTLEYFFKYPHLKTFYKGSVFDFNSIISIYENIIKGGNSCELFGSTFHGLAPVNYYTLDEIFTSNIYDFNSEKKHPIIIDCGANIGLGILYFKQKHPKSIIYAFEPDTINYEFLLQNIASYNWKETVFPFQQLVSNGAGFEFFEELGNAGSKISKSEKGKRIKKIRLHDFIKNLDTEIDFLKIDIEGAEFDVLPDLKEVFPKIKKMYIEFHCEDSNFNSFYKMINELLSPYFHFQITTNFLENENIYQAISSQKVKTYYNCFVVNKNNEKQKPYPLS